LSLRTYSLKILQVLTKLLKWLQAKGFFHLLLVNFLVQFLGFGTSLMVAKLLTPVELGEIRIIQSYAQVLTLLAGFGLNTALLKYCSENLPNENREAILRFAMWRSCLTTGITLILVLILSSTGSLTSSQHLNQWLLIYSLSIPFSVLTGLFTAYLQAIRKIKAMAKTQALIKTQSVLLILVSTWQWGFRGFVIATAVAYLVGLIPLARVVGLRFLSVSNTSVPRGLPNIALFSLLANGMNVLGKYGDLFILDHFSTDRIGIGYYSLALTFTLAAEQVTNTVQAIVTPHFSEHGDDEDWVRHQLKRNQLRMAALSLGVSVLVYAAAYAVIPRVYGPGYQATLTYLPILLLRYVIWSCYAIFAVVLVGLGLMRYNFMISALATPASLLLSYVFLTYLEITGIAWAKVISAVLALILTLAIGGLALKRTFEDQANDQS